MMAKKSPRKNPSGNKAVRQITRKVADRHLYQVR